MIDVLDSVTFRRIEEKSMRKLSWNNLIGLERLAESAGKVIYLLIINFSMVENSIKE